MSDFALENGKVSKGVISAVLSAVKYLVIPVLIVSIILSLLSGMAEGYLPLEEFEAIRLSMIIFAIPVIALAFMTGFYPKGSYSRMTFGIVYVASICLWLWLVAQGGRIDASIEFVGLALDFSALLLLFIFAASLKSLIYVAEAPSYREEYLRKKDMKDETQPMASVPTERVAPAEQPQETAEVQIETKVAEEPATEEEGEMPEPTMAPAPSESTRVEMPRPSIPSSPATSEQAKSEEDGSLGNL